MRLAYLYGSQKEDDRGPLSIQSSLGKVVLNVFTLTTHPGYTIPESIELIIEDQAFSRSYDLAPCPTPAPAPVFNLDRQHTGRLRKTDNLLTGQGGRGGGGAKSYDRKKA